MKPFSELSFNNYKVTLACVFVLESTQPLSSDRVGVLCIEKRRVSNAQRKTNF